MRPQTALGVSNFELYLLELSVVVKWWFNTWRFSVGTYTV